MRDIFMEPKVVFYILNAADLKARNLCACKLIDKAYQSEKRVYVYCVTPEEAENLNTQLWTFNDISFIPHEINDSPNAPVVIGWEKPLTGFEILINFTLAVPEFFADFKHIIEIIPNESEIKAKGREKYKYYQEQGFKIETHKI